MSRVQFFLFLYSIFKCYFCNKNFIENTVYKFFIRYFLQKKDKPKEKGAKETNGVGSQNRIENKKPSMKSYQKYMENNNMNFKGIPSSVKEFYQDKNAPKKGKKESKKITEVIGIINAPVNVGNVSKSKLQPAITPAMRLSMLQKKPNDDSGSQENRKRISKLQVPQKGFFIKNFI